MKKLLQNFNTKTTNQSKIYAELPVQALSEDECAQLSGGSDTHSPSFTGRYELRDGLGRSKKRSRCGRASAVGWQRLWRSYASAIALRAFVVDKIGYYG